MALAAIWNAPGRRSPSCWRISSADTLPLLIICCTAFSAPAASSPDSPRAVDASDNAVNMRRVSSPSRAVPLLAAASLPYLSAAEAISRPRRSASSRTNAISRAASWPDTERNEVSSFCTFRAASIQSLARAPIPTVASAPERAPAAPFRERKPPAFPFSSLSSPASCSFSAACARLISSAEATPEVLIRSNA
ncbi:MAG: hypothetical protein A4E68_01268 [Syntrophaceae bacterium PtaB.Bin095]|nr:MAG: hypothetical protein A4E68_01268 [Syntrophaceae bacterium PtaB.Bin095]